MGHAYRRLDTIYSLVFDFKSSSGKEKLHTIHVSYFTYLVRIDFELALFASFEHSVTDKNAKNADAGSSCDKRSVQPRACTLFVLWKLHLTHTIMIVIERIIRNHSYRNTFVFLRQRILKK